MFHFHCAPVRKLSSTREVQNNRVLLSNGRYRLTLSQEEALAIRTVFCRIEHFLTANVPLPATERLIIVQQTRFLVPVEAVCLSLKEKGKIPFGDDEEEWRQISGHGLYCLTFDRHFNIQALLRRMEDLLPR